MCALEIPLVIQDKIFVGPDIAIADPTWAAVTTAKSQTVGSLWYPHVYEKNRWRFTGNVLMPDPSCIPEMFGDTMLVTGTVFPVADVEARRYRIRLLNACQARFLNLQLTNGLPNMLTAPAERWDLLVDFSGLAGQSVILYNDAPSPFPMGTAVND